ncbi:endonuclease/exonuclease/phosphatase family protein [Streptomyces sp. 4F14]|uniref:endonuclease/exonuclease/phosphatase family protein n=1 Tax=Streptomyces sp. 4F14 TaxID=3394380 RepID=UPI003A85EE81
MNTKTTAPGSTLTSPTAPSDSASLSPAGLLFRAVSWNLLNGGLDGAGEVRLDAQVGYLAELGPDILALQECTRWDEKDRAEMVAAELGLTVTKMASSRVGDGRNYTMLLHNPARFFLVEVRLRGAEIFHHALIKARLRPHGAPSDGSGDFNVLATHLSWTDGATRLAEAGWMTDYAGPFPGEPDRALLLGDLNCPHPDDAIDWADVPPNLQPRYRLMQADGAFGNADTRAFQVLLNSGWQNPETLTGQPRTATVGHYYANEPTPMRLDHALVHNLTVHAYRTHDTGRVSDHKPVVLDAVLTAA